MRIKILILVILLTGKLYSQKLVECATPSNFPNPLKNVPASRLQQRLSNVTTMLRMCIHICRNDDGSLQPMSPAEVEEEVRTTDSVYNIGGICFAIVGVDYLNSTTLNNNITDSTLANYLVPNCFNVFVVRLIPNPNGTTFGSAFGIPNNYIAIVPAGFGPRRTFIHELGHDLGLFHTFHGQPVEANSGTCKELVNGSNADTCGDFVADTPADPYIETNSANNCNSVNYNTGVWTGTCKDANNQLYTPSMHNYMSYWPNYSPACDRNVFTNGQFITMQNAINNTTSLANCIAPDILFLTAATTSAGKLTQAARNLVQAGNISSLGDYNVLGSANA